MAAPPTRSEARLSVVMEARPAASAYKAREKRFKQLSDEQIRIDGDMLDVHAAALPSGVIRVGTWRWREDALATTDPRSDPNGHDDERPVLSFAACGAPHEGFFVVPDAINSATQLEIAHACLTEYVEPPHVTNMHQQNEQVAELWRKARASHPREPAKAPALGKLHWGAAGYHYDWTARKYYPQDFSPVPELLATLGQRCAEACGETLAAEAVIVNFYKKNSTMGGHQDDVELTMAHPVVSLSLGSHCVFLKGTTTKEDAPLEVLLRSGDLAVLSGNSRLSYHGVAKVLPTEFDISDAEFEALVEKKVRQQKKEEPQLTADEWREELRAVQKYLDTHRININIRQVYDRHARPNDAGQMEGATAVDKSQEDGNADDEQSAVKRQKV